MASIPWTKFFWADYDTDTSDLTVLEHGAYFLLLKAYYETGKALPLALGKVHRMTSAFTDSERLAIAFMLDRFFIKQKDGFHNKRADKEIAERNAKIKKCKDAAKLGGKKKLANAKANARANAKKKNKRTLVDLDLDLDLDLDVEKESKKKNIKKKLAEKPEGVSDQTWDDFQELRKAKKAPLTETSLKSIVSEAKKAKWTLERALVECCVRGWQGFKAQWVEEDPEKTNWNVLPPRLN